jgi:FtsP/CotA-like multicopper oxidase with cupredoxin domain
VNDQKPTSTVSRRSLMLGLGGFAAAGATAAAIGTVGLPRPALANVQHAFAAKPGLAKLIADDLPATKIWGYGGMTPGPEIRLAQGERLRVDFENGLPEETTVHWHGMRLPNAMDGVPGLTQAPVQPGEKFLYEFDVPDAGTFFYHPHVNTSAQLGRGLYGPLIIEEPNPPVVDRDVVWMLDDWRLENDFQIAGGFGNLMDMSHGGRIGNWASINGEPYETFPVQAGERVRLRIINAANARVFGLEFQDHAPQVIAYDGQPVAPHPLPGGRLVLGPAMRADLILDMTGAPGQQFAVRDTYYKGNEFKLLDLVYGPNVVREQLLDSSIRLAANPIPDPNMAGAGRHRMVLGGGMMGTMAGAVLDGQSFDMVQLADFGKAWAVNGVVAGSDSLAPVISAHLGETVAITMHNDTAFEHPMHLHGYAFRVFNRDGNKPTLGEWRDTILVDPAETVEIAFVADNPGNWLFHCHTLEHAAGGLLAVVRVT